MDDELLFVERVDPHRSLCVSSLAKETVAESEADNLGSDHGFFIYEISDDPLAAGISILAKAASFEAALRLIDLWRGRSVAA